MSHNFVFLETPELVAPFAFAYVNKLRRRIKQTVRYMLQHLGDRTCTCLTLFLVAELTLIARYYLSMAYVRLCHGWDWSLALRFHKPTCSWSCCLLLRCLPWSSVASFLKRRFFPSASYECRPPAAVHVYGDLTIRLHRESNKYRTVIIFKQIMGRKRNCKVVYYLGTFRTNATCLVSLPSRHVGARFHW